MNQESRIKNQVQKLPIVILHGWRLTGEKYQRIQEIFKSKDFPVFAPTLPGSGNIPLVKPVMSVDDYVHVVLKLLPKQKVFLLGHSFGGRIAAKLAAEYPERVEKLILTGAPLIKQPLSVKKKILVAVGKPIKVLIKRPFLKKYAYKLLGEMDYVKAPEEIKETFKKIIAEDLSVYLSRITVPTLILWGAEDIFVGKNLGKQIASRIKGSVYKAIPEGSHKVPYENPEEFARIVLDFIKSS